MPSQHVTTDRVEALEEIGEEKVFQLVVAHGSVKKMMNALFKPHPNHPEGRVGHWAFNEWIRRGGPDRKARWENAKLVRAEVAVDEANELLEDATVATVRLKAEQAKQKRWLAGLLNPDYSNKTSVNVQNNTLNVIGHGLSDALKALDNQNPHEITTEASHQLPTRPDSNNTLPATRSEAQRSDGEIVAENE